MQVIEFTSLICIYLTVAPDLLLTIQVIPMREVKTGFLMILVCTALYVQCDPRIWSGLCQLLARMLVGPS